MDKIRYSNGRIVDGNIKEPEMEIAGNYTEEAKRRLVANHNFGLEMILAYEQYRDNVNLSNVLEMLEKLEEVYAKHSREIFMIKKGRISENQAKKIICDLNTMPNVKIKIGDKVRIIKNQSYYPDGILNSELTAIEDLDSNKSCIAVGHPDYPRNAWIVRIEDIEVISSCYDKNALPKIKVGDIVRIVDIPEIREKYRGGPLGMESKLKVISINTKHIDVVTLVRDSRVYSILITDVEKVN